MIALFQLQSKHVFGIKVRCDWKNGRKDVFVRVGIDQPSVGHRVGALQRREDEWTSPGSGIHLEMNVQLVISKISVFRIEKVFVYHIDDGHGLAGGED